MKCVTQINKKCNCNKLQCNNIELIQYHQSWDLTIEKTLD